MVSSVDGNKQNEVDSRNRTESTRREAELNKKHAAEVERMQQQNYEKLKELQSTYQKQMDDQREASREAITSRDIKYQQEMEDLRRMNREKIMGLTGNYEDRLQRTRENSKMTIESEKKTNDIQKTVMSENLMAELKKKDKEFGEAIEKTYKGQKDGMLRERETLSEKHNKELSSQSQERNDTVERLHGELRNLKRSKNSQEKELKDKIYDQSKRMEDNFESTVSSERRTANEQQKLQRNAFNNSLDSVQKKYGEALYEEKLRTDKNLDNLRETVNDRQQGEFGVLARRLRESKEGAVLKAAETKRLSDLERKDLMAGLKNNLESSEESRQAAIKQSNLQNAQNIKDIIKKNTDINQSRFAYDRDQINTMRMQHEDEVLQKTTFLEAENERLRSASELRDKQRADMFERDRKSLEDYYNKSLMGLKKAHEESLSDQRMVAMKEKSQATEKLSIQMRSNEAKFADKMAIVLSKNEKDIQDLKNQHTKDMDVLRRNYETRIANETKLSTQNLESQKLKYEMQLSTQKEAYEERLRQMQRNMDQERINMSKAKT